MVKRSAGTTKAKEAPRRSHAVRPTAANREEIVGVHRTLRLGDVVLRPAPLVRRLMTVPGVGAVVALTFCAGAGA
jgi:hypothetical protein